MRKHCALFLLPGMLVAMPGTAQIPNHGFEDWTPHGSHLEPGGWWTANDSVGGGGWFPVERSTDHHPLDVGSYSILIKNNVVLLPSWGAYGITWTGDLSGNDNPVFPITGHPHSLWGWYKWSPQNGDTMEVHAVLCDNGVDINIGSFKTAVPTTGWTPFSLTFSPYTTADSARIMISASWDNDMPLPHGNSALLIDHLRFDALITGVDEVAGIPAVTLAPNPVRDLLTIDLGAPRAERVHLRILDAAGRTVLQQDLRMGVQRHTVAVEGFAPGLHVVEITDDQGPLLHRSLVIGE